MESLIDRIRSIPRLTKENSVFTISLPTEIQRHIASNWPLVIRNLQQTINIENVILNPSIDEFKNILYDKRKNILIELTHTEQGIVLRDDRVFTSKEIESGDNLSHLKYILTGICTCNLPLLENGSYVQSLLSKGAGIINGSHRNVSSDTGLKRLNQLIEIIKHIEHYNVPAYYLIDIIDQMQDIPGRGTINLGQKWTHRERFLG